MGRRRKGKGHRPARRAGRPRDPLSGRQQRRPHDRPRRRGVQVPPDPVGDPLPGPHLRDRQRRDDRPARCCSTRSRASSAAAIDVSGLQDLRQRPPDHALPRAARPGRRGAARQAADRHHAGAASGPATPTRRRGSGIRVQDLLDETILRKKIMAALEPKRHALRPHAKDPALDLHAMTEEYVTYGHRLEPHIADTAMLCHETLEQGGTVVFEGAQGTLLDIDHGTYPFVTSSNPIAGAACVGAGVGPEGDRRGLGRREGLRDARRRGAVPDRARRRDRPPHARARARVRHHHRPPAPLRLDRPRRAALRGAHQRPHRPRDHEARRAAGHRPAAGLHELPPRRGRRVRRLPLPPVDPAQRRGRRPRSCPASTRTSATAARSPTSRARRATTSSFIAEFVGVPVKLIGVGPGREQVIWADGARPLRAVA